MVNAKTVSVKPNYDVDKVNFILSFNKACETGDLKKVKKMLTYISKSKPNSGIDYHYSAQVAIGGGHIKIFKLLLSKSNININYDRDVFLVIAATSGSTELFNLLLELGSNFENAYNNSSKWKRSDLLACLKTSVNKLTHLKPVKISSESLAENFHFI
jgi:hypothetical protein